MIKCRSIIINSAILILLLFCITITVSADDNLTDISDAFIENTIEAEEASEIAETSENPDEGSDDSGKGADETGSGIEDASVTREQYSEAAEGTRTSGKAITTELSGQYLTITVNNANAFSIANAAIWSETGGQDDLAWYPMTKNSDGTFKASVNLGLHKSIGTFFIHVYSGNTFITGDSVYLESFAAPVMKIAENEENKNHVIASIANAYDFSNMKVAVWGKLNGQNDIKWYDLTDCGNGTFTANIDLSKHVESGMFYFHAYGYSSGKKLFVDGNTYDYSGVNFPDPVADAVLDGQILTVTLVNAETYASANAAVWSEDNGQDDLKWYDMEKQPDGSFAVEVNLGQHYSVGKFDIHVYSGKKYMGGKTVQLDSYTAPEITAEKATGSESKVIITVENALGFSDVKTAAWGKKDGQNDIKWYTLTDKGDGVFAAEADLLSHGESGMFYFHAYGTFNGKNRFIDGKELDMSEIKIIEPSMETELDDQFLTICLKDAQKYPAARAAVWSEANGQDDVVWYELTKQPDGTYSANINLGLHRSTGQFIIHAYSGNTFIAGKRVELDNYESMKLTAESSEDGSSKVTVSVMNAFGLSNVKAAIWGSKDGQNDVKWYSLIETDKGTFSADIDLSSHNETGIFFIHVYGTNAGTNIFIDGLARNIVIYNKNIGSPELFVENAQQAVSLAGRSGDNNKLDILFLGNSLTYHGVGSGWFGEWGMAATTEDQDFVHVVQQAFSPYVDTSCRAYNFWRYEREIANRAALLSTLDSIVSSSDDLIVLQLGDNAQDAATWNKDFEAVINYCKKLAPNAKIVMLGNFLHNSGADYVKETVAEKQKLQMISIYDIGDNPLYKCGVGTYVTGTDGNIHEVTEYGVGVHPGDWGMALIGKRIVKTSVI